MQADRIKKPGCGSHSRPHKSSLKLRGLTGAVVLTLICQNPTPCHSCRIKFWSFCRTSWQKIFLLSNKRFRRGEIMTHLTKINWLRYAFFLLNLILIHIRIIILFAWASLWALFFASSLNSILLKIPIVFPSQASSQPTLQKTSLLFLAGAWFHFVVQLVQVSSAVCAGTLQVHVYSFLISATAALRPVSHVRVCSVPNTTTTARSVPLPYA